MNAAPALEQAPRVLKAHGEWIYIEKVVPKTTESGLLHLPETFDHQHSARKKFNAVNDTFRARVLSVGSRVTADVSQLDEIIVYTFAEGDGRKLYTGENVGEKRRMFIKAEDIVCVLGRS